jgi:predicted DNA-binding transcriptional regulator AlpA
VSLCWVHMKCRRRCKDPLPAHRVGKYIRFKRSEVLAWFDSTLTKRKAARA